MAMINHIGHKITVTVQIQVAQFFQAKVLHVDGAVREQVVLAYQVPATHTVVVIIIKGLVADSSATHNEGATMSDE
jgi:hypothetical protein